MQKKVLVTGGAGFIGTNLINQLLKENAEVFSLDDYSTGNKDNESNLAKYINGDIESIGNISESNFDVCFHLAAQSRVQPSFADPEDSFRVNVQGTLKVMEWAKEQNVKVIYAGSSSKHHDPSDSPYAMTKFLGEEVCKLYKKSYGVNVEISRFYNVYGPYATLDEKFGNVIGIWTYQAMKGKPLTIVGDGEQRRDFIYVGDLVDGLIRIANTELKHEDAWEIGTGVNYSINELFEMFTKNFNVSSVKIEDQPGNYRKTLRINDDMIKKLDWSPEDRLNDYINSLKL
jgi:UDP-glucose 4-epimerase